MGIPGIYREIGQGDRVALSKFAVEKLEETGHPLRLAIDISIWQFEAQSAQGGLNPVLRTLYYRFIKLLSLSIQPLFVFDGPNKPPVKRNVRTTKSRATGRNRAIIEMIDHFGFNYVIAPGEAEAECALLQKEGVVDAVLSEDVDTLMFGCTISMRNWKDESGRGGKTPTHVEVYHSTLIKAGKSGLDSEGMILIALMSGGDYATEGIPGCGIKTACEAARAGFGHDLLKIASESEVGFTRWRERLNHELRTNESNFFRTRRSTLKVPENFPDLKILRYYTHPSISSAKAVADLKKSIRWNRHVNVPELRRFVAEHLDWPNLTGAYKFTRGLAPALLVQKLLSRTDTTLYSDDMARHATPEKKLIEGICGKRKHDSTGGMLEIRVAYFPAQIVGLNFELEHAEEPSEGPDSESEAEGDKADEVDKQLPTSLKKKRETSKYDPKLLEKIWILEKFAKMGVPLAVDAWETEQRLSKKGPLSKSNAKGVVSRGGMPRGALDAYVKVTKPKTGGNKTATFMDGTSKHQAQDNIEGPTRPSDTVTLPNLQEAVATNTLRTLDESATMPASSSKPARQQMKTAKQPQQAGAVTNTKLTSLVINRRPPDKLNKTTHTSKGPLKVASHTTNHKTLDLRSFPPIQCLTLDTKPIKLLNAQHNPSQDKLEVIEKVVLRESLPGSWKEVRDSDVGTVTPNRLHLGVTILDMTESSQLS